jgi:Tfp pilus assembly protein PilF
MGVTRFGIWPVVLLATGCAMTRPTPAPVAEPTPAQRGDVRSAEALLDLGLKQYDDGLYKRAASTLQQALEQNLSPANRVVAHKHLAFIYCTSNRLTLCRSEFAKAIEVDPRFDLAPAEAGHPQWGPVFRSVRARSPANS